MKNPVLSLFAREQLKKTFTNPLLPSGADPCCVYKDGYYYYTHTTGDNITLWKTDCISKLKTAEKKVIYTPPSSGPYSKQLWAPEIHLLNNKWYIYFAADGGKNKTHRMWVLENEASDPLAGQWVLKGKLVTPGDKWSIDGSVFEHNKKVYFLWSGWQGNVDGQQNIYIAKMKNPWTIEGERVVLSCPELPWETIGCPNGKHNPAHVKVNEGPSILKNAGKLFLIYSASGCWTDYYALGMLTADAGCDPMDATAWKKSLQPVFKKCRDNNVYAPGHNSFFKSPDGTENYILYHANTNPKMGFRNRSPRAQKFGWNKDGSPNFGLPVKQGDILQSPSANWD